MAGASCGASGARSRSPAMWPRFSKPYATLPRLGLGGGAVSAVRRPRRGLPFERRSRHKPPLPKKSWIIYAYGLLTLEALRQFVGRLLSRTPSASALSRREPRDGADQRAPDDDRRGHRPLRGVD